MAPQEVVIEGKAPRKFPSSGRGASKSISSGRGSVSSRGKAQYPGKAYLRLFARGEYAQDAIELPLEIKEKRSRSRRDFLFLFRRKENLL